MQNKSCDANIDQDMKTVEQEKIRVKLDLTEVDEKEKKKKPVITPRRSLMLSNNSMKVTEATVNSKENASNAKSLQEKSTKDNDIEKSSMFRAEQEQKGRKSQSLDGNFEKEKKRDSGTTPKRRLLPKHHDSQTSSQPEILDDTVEQPKKLEYEIEKVQSPKKNTIRVTLGKDPLAPKRVPDSSSQKKNVPLLTRHLSSPIPPPPPPPPVQVTKSVSLERRSVQNIAPRGSMADELKSRLNKRQSVSEGMLRGNKSSGSNVFTKQLPGQPGKDILVPGENNGAPKLMKISEMSDSLTPQQSDGLPSFVLQSMVLQDQKDNLRSISKPHLHHLDDLSNASQEQLTSIADILKKAVMGRRLAMKEDGDSVSQSLESAASGWSIDL